MISNCSNEMNTPNLKTKPTGVGIEYARARAGVCVCGYRRTTAWLNAMFNSTPPW